MCISNIGDHRSDLRGKGRFKGAEIDEEVDTPRLQSQLDRIKYVMSDEKYRSLAEISALTGDPQASISAQLRNLRKVEFGRFRVNRKVRGSRKNGLYEYQVLPPVVFNYLEDGQGELL